MNTTTVSAENSLFTQCLTVAITAINKTYWGFWIFLCSVLITLVFLISADDPNGGEVAAYIFLYSMFGLLGFCAIGANMVEMSKKMRQPLSPDYPKNFWCSALVLLAAYAFFTFVFFAQFGVALLFHALVFSSFTATTGLFITNGMSWLRSTSIFGGLVLLLLLIDAYFDNVSDEVFIAFYSNIFLWVNLLMVVATVLFSQRWRAALTNRETSVFMLQFQHLAGGILKYIDIRNPQQSKNVKTGYVLNPGFMKIHSFRSRPVWWWMKFALIDPGTLRATLFWFAVMVYFGGISSELSLIFLQVMGIVLMIGIPAEFLSKRPLELRRLYLQLPNLSRTEFLVKVGTYHCVMGLVVVLGAGMLIVFAEFIVRTGLVIQCLALGIIGYALVTSALLTLNLLRININPILRAVLSVPICAFCVLIYIAIAAEYLTISQWILVTATIAAYLLMLCCFRIWSKADIEL
ncbi:MAG: hypothetical protein GKR91_03425 [Pseudomonadales bacterium]|nr:hypothetical protein [Pseudomonadales bacterium]